MGNPTILQISYHLPVQLILAVGGFYSKLLYNYHVGKAYNLSQEVRYSIVLPKSYDLNMDK